MIHYTCLIPSLFTSYVVRTIEHIANNLTSCRLCQIWRLRSCLTWTKLDEPVSVIVEVVWIFVAMRNWMCYTAMVCRKCRFSNCIIVVLIVSTAPVLNAFAKFQVNGSVQDRKTWSRSISIAFNFHPHFILLSNDFNRWFKSSMPSGQVITGGGVLWRSGTNYINDLSSSLRAAFFHASSALLRTSHLVSFWIYASQGVDLEAVLLKQKYWNWVNSCILVRHFSTWQSFDESVEDSRWLTALCKLKHSRSFECHYEKFTSSLLRTWDELVLELLWIALCVCTTGINETIIPSNRQSWTRHTKQEKETCSFSPSYSCRIERKDEEKMIHFLQDSW